MKKVASPFCPFCPSECQTLWHLFINCTHANSFGTDSRSGTQSLVILTKLLLSELEVMSGIIRYHTYCLALNHLIILGKYFLYVNALNTLIYKFDDFILILKWYCDENHIFPIEPILKHKQVACMTRKMLSTIFKYLFSFQRYLSF